MEARAAFMDKFDEAEAKAQAMEEEIMEDIAAVEIAEEMIEEEVLGLRSVDPERRRRDAEADAQVFLTQPLHYAPTYPYYNYNTALYVPTVKKVDEVNMEEMVEAEKMRDEEMMETRKMAYYVPQYAPSYYYPSVIP